MGYLKISDNSIVLGVIENKNRESNISREEYMMLSDMLRDCKQGTVVIERDGTYEYADAPDPGEDEIDDAEAFDIIFGGGDA